MKQNIGKNNVAKIYFNLNLGKKQLIPASQISIKKEGFSTSQQVMFFKIYSTIILTRTNLKNLT
jgi:hypothetical protein